MMSWITKAGACIVVIAFLYQIIAFGLDTRATAETAEEKAEKAKIQAEQNTAQVEQLRQIHEAIATKEEAERNLRRQLCADEKLSGSDCAGLD
jgi:Tfp pilus assembly protein PilO